MNTDLVKSIEEYCMLLPYLNTSANPNDDYRLYLIAYLSEKYEEPLEVNDFLPILKKNPNLQDESEDSLVEFIESSVISRISNARYYYSYAKRYESDL